MSRMKTFLTYLLAIVGFMVLSFILEDALLENTYEKMAGAISTGTSNIAISDISGKSSAGNGKMSFKLTNNSDLVNSDYIKIDLYSDQQNLAATKYFKISDLGPGESKEYALNFQGQNLDYYKISIVKPEDLPDYTNIISIFGWEVDMSNVLGRDLSNATIFGNKITDMFSAENIKVAGHNAWLWTVTFLNTIPWWGYAIGAGIIFWYMPKGFLFGVFPF